VIQKVFVGRGMQSMAQRKTDMGKATDKRLAEYK